MASVLGATLSLTALNSGATPSSEDIVKVKERHESSFMRTPGVVGVGVGVREGEFCIKVFAEDRTPEVEDQIPQQLEGFKVDVEAIGPVQPSPATEPPHKGA